MTIKRMDHVGVVVDDLTAAVAFFAELGLEVEGDGPSPVEGFWGDQVVGIDGVQVEIVLVRTPDGHSRLELTKVPYTDGREPRVDGSDHARPAPHHVRCHRHRRVVARMQAHGAELVGEVAQYEEVSASATSAAPAAR